MLRLPHHNICLLSASCAEITSVITCNRMEHLSNVRHTELGTIVIEPRTMEPELLWGATNNNILTAQRLSLDTMRPTK